MTAHADLTERLADWPLFDALDHDHLAHLADHCRPMRLPRGQTLLRRGQPATACYGVVTGLVQLAISNADGLVKVVEIIGPRQTLGEAVMFLRRPYPVDAIALTDSDLIAIPADAINTLLDDDPRFARAMLASMSARLHSLVKDVERYTLQSATQRVVAHLLDDLGGGDPAAHLHPGTVTLRPGKAVIASRLGMTPETFSRVIRDLAGRGLITPRGRCVDVADPAALVAALT